ncbi:MAG TPA: efflux RND transporter permease subunit [Gemmatimonadaceae bacterium]|nr:efflux RND transporter permease subunit [Gemmatimonadaceae bacterium]
MSDKRSLWSLLAQQRRFVYMTVALVSAAGIWSALTLPSSIYPELKFSRITIVTEGSSLGARQVLFSITRPLEEAVAVVLGVTRVNSRSIRGGSEVNVTFAPGTDMQYALEQVRAQVNQVRGDLPAGIDVEVEMLSPSVFPILQYNLEGGDPPTLYDIAQYQIRPVISRVPGVGHVDVMASNIREIEVIADPTRLAGQQMTFDDLATQIQQSATVSAVGRMPSDYRQYLIVTTSEAASVEDVANLVVGHGLRVSDVATVTPGTEDNTRIVAGDGKPAALINITRQVGGNTVAIADSVAAIAAAFKKTLPNGVQLKAVYDQAALVRDAVKSVRDAMLIGAVLAVIILLLFLRHGRITAISASSIPLTMAMTVYVMSLFGQTFNLMTLGAMAIAIGLVIDDAVVVTENIVRHLHLNPDRDAAIREAVQELIWPVTTSTITTVVVFLPLGLLTGVEGQFFHALSVTLTIAVLISLMLALTIIPLLSEQFLTAVDAEQAEHAEEAKAAADSAADGRSPAVVKAPHRGVLARVGAAVDSLSDIYVRALAGTLKHTRITIAVCIALAAAGWLAHQYVGSGFLPDMDEGAFVLDYFSPGGTALAETDRMVHQVEQILLSTPEVAGISRRTGAELGLFATEQNRGDLSVRLTPQSKRDRSSFEIIDDVRAKVERTVPRLRVEFVQIISDELNDLAGASNPVEIKLFGADLTALEAYGTKLGEKIEKVDGVEDLFNGVAEPTAELAMTVDEAEANRIGLTPLQVGDQVAGALLGVDAGQVRLSDRAIGIRVRAPDSVRFNPTLLASIPIVPPQSHAAVPLGALATFKPEQGRSQLTRENQQQMIDLTSDISGRSLGTVMNDIKPILAANPPPPGIRVELAGQYASQQDAFRALLLVLALAVLSVIAVMVIQFQSFVEPAVVLLAAPLSFVGAMVLLLVTGTPLNVSSFMGLILLVGLIVKNGIILLDFTRHLMRVDRLPLSEALQRAGRIRLRPILMTTLCTLFGLLPLALGLGAGSELQKPLALAVIGGLALSTPITLFVVPTLLVAIHGREHRIPG